MASDPGGGEGSWADDPGKAQSLEFGLQHGDGGGDDLEMVAGESTESHDVGELCTKMTKKNIFKMEMQVRKLRTEINQETDPKAKLMKCECLDVCTRELVILKERLQKESCTVPKIKNWAIENKRETRAQTVKRKNIIAKKDTDYKTVYNIVEQGNPGRYECAVAGGSHLSSCVGSVQSANTNAAKAAEKCVPADEGLTAVDSMCSTDEVNASGTPGSEQESASCPDIISETSLSAVIDSLISDEPVAQAEADIADPVLEVQPSAVSVNGVQVTQRSGADTGGSAVQSAEERSSPDPPADRPQYRRLFSSVTRPTNPTPQRRNAVRIRYSGPEENLPSRLYIGKVLLKEFMKFKASEVFALIHVPSSRNYDISFKLQYSLDLFWSIYNDTKEHAMWEHLHVIQLTKPQVVTATVLFQSEVVALADLQHWLSRYCEVKRLPTKIYDEEEIWNGGYSVKIQLVQENGVTRHLPHSFYLGSERGICYYPGQPRRCHRCGGRHLAFNCSRIKCSLCGQFGHVKDECTGPVICNLCLGPGHTFRECPHAEHNKEETFKEAMEEEQEDVSICVDTTPEPGSPSEDVSQSTRDPAPETNVPSVDAAQVSPATENRGHAKSKISSHSVTKASKHLPNTSKEPADTAAATSKEPADPAAAASKKPADLAAATSKKPADPAAATSIDEEGFQTVKRRSKIDDSSRKKITAAKKSPESPVLAITGGRYCALGEDDQEEEAEMEQVSSHIPDDEPQDEDADPPMSTKRWGVTGHSSGRRKKSRKDM